jgi:serine/threonine protein phosphatase PrpC
MVSKKLIKTIYLYLKTLQRILIIIILQFGKHIIYLNISDGHGMYGHDVSSYLKENLPNALNNEIKNKKKLSLDGNINLNKIIEDVFLYTNSKLFNEASIDTNFSGSTCISVIYTPEKLICANVGDSRAILGRCVNGSK